MIEIKTSGDNVTLIHGSDSVELQHVVGGWRLVQGVVYPKDNEDLVALTLNGRVLRIKPLFFTYEELTRLAGLKPEFNPSMVYKTPLISGILTPSGSLKVSEGMVINVCYTGNA